MSKQRISSQAGFTLIEVGVAALVLVIGFIGMVRAMTFTASMMDHARRQTLAVQILTNEIEQLRLESWTTVDSISSTTTWSSATAYTKGTIVSYQGGWFICITANTNTIPTQTNTWSAYMVWSSGRAYSKLDIVSYNGSWYRCIQAHTGQTPAASTSYWKTYSGQIPVTGTLYGATFSVARSANSLVSGSLREVTITVSWSVTTGRRNADNTPLILTYSRVNTAYFGKNGLNLSYQRS